MGTLGQKQQDGVQREKDAFVLSDVSKEELSRRRIAVYSYVL